ncbi:MAG TPA: hypothetical protein VF031_05830, partial [Alphaproteobacteria bacterium]
EMALALASPEAARRRAPAAPLAEEDEPGPAAAAEPESRRAPAAGEPAPGGEPPPPAEAEAPAEPAAGPRRLLAINKPGRLELPKDAAADATRSLSVARGVGRRRIASAKAAATSGSVRAGQAEVPLHEPPGGNGATAEAESGERAKAIRRSRKTQQGLPEGWIIDDEGFVVPGPS